MIVATQPKLLEKIKKTCYCGTSFEVFPCLDRVQCCSRKCAAKIKGDKLRGRRLPAIRACKCGKVEELKRGKCAECAKVWCSASYFRSKDKWTPQQRETRRQCSVRAKKKLRSTPEGKARHNMYLRESEHRRRARIRDTSVGRVSYIKLLKEFGMICNICKNAITDGELSFDHVIPLVRGGTHTYENIRPAHVSCNKKKNRRTQEEYACLSRPWHQS